MDQGYLGKKILVCFADGPNHSSTKRGICTLLTDNSLGLDSKHYIPRGKIYRIEVLD